MPHEYRIFKKRKSTPTTAVKQKELNSYYSEPEMIELNPILTPNVELKKSPEPEAKKPKPNPPEEAPTAREIELAKRFNVSQRFLSEYGPRLIQSHELWTKNSKILRNSKNDVLDRNPLVWSVEEVAEYISYIPGCENSCKIFRENAIDGSAFLCLTKDDIENIMKVKVGPSIKIISEIIHLREEVVLRFKI